ncbi:hypothetical protein BMETH_117_1 [methanotrophic bacterial endosymbiont of Bathymodiolus sp.]|nr:hypothetical protein BMETH_117_1 [methanotrophic bacterial endosymbiont of Bathymodiolus sp.]
MLHRLSYPPLQKPYGASLFHHRYLQYTYQAFCVPHPDPLIL